MSNVFGGGSNPNNELFGVKVNSSDLGKPLTVIMGTAKTNQLIFWVDGFKQSPDSSKKGGGGKGGGKDGQYLYSADIVAGLCAGPISGIGDVWTGQSWLGSPQANESYTISSPSYTYTPANASALTNNYGVSPASTYTGSYSDYSAPGSTSVGNSTSTAFTQVAYGTALTTGTYSINPTTNAYNFSASDVGKTVFLSYSYLLTTINQQETDLIPSGHTLSVSPAYKFEADLGVVYADTGSNPNAGEAFTRVSGTPTVAKTYSVSGSMPATYRFASADVGAAVTITFQVQNTNAVGQNETTMLDFTLAEGFIGQSPFSFLSSSYPGAALGYSGAATVLYEPMDLGVGGEIQQISFEVITPDRMGGTYATGAPVLDCNPVHCMTRVLTDTQWGLGVGAQPFPTSFIDNGSGGTWGSPGTPSVQSVGSTAWNWFAANNFLISPVIDSQDSADSTMSKWLEAGMCAAFVSEGLLKLVPYGDTSAAANGCTWTAPTSFVVALDDTCFIGKEGTDPVTIKRSPWQDAFNEVQVQWDNRNNQYAKEITAESDQSLINRYGSRIEDPQDWDFICTLPAATFAANLRLKHGTYIRNTYEFVLPFNYSYLEPMDIVTITTSSVWAQGINNTNLGVTNLPIRLTKVVDDPKEGIKIEAEDYPYGAGQPTIFNKGLSSAEVISNIYASPGTSEVVLFEASGRLVQYGGNQIWMGAAGTSTDYGATNVWVSQDNVNYVQVATLNQPSVIGELAAVFPSGSDPDTTNTLIVELAENSASLSSGTTAAADNDTMLCYVDGEVISYSAAAVTGQNTWTLGSYIRRGQLGTPISSHAIGSLFMRIDGTVFKYTYDPTWQGKTVYFKFQAVNTFGNNAQPLSNLSAVSFTISDTNSGAVDAETGIVLDASIPPVIVQGATGTNVNLVPDSNLQFGFNGYWTSPGLGWTVEQIISTSNPDPASPTPGCNAFVVPAAGNSGGYHSAISAQFNLIAGAQYTLSGFIDAYYVTAGSPCWCIYNTAISTQYAGIYQAIGQTGRISSTFTFSPSGVAAGTIVPVVLLFDTTDCTFTNVLVASAPMIESGSLMTAYIASVASQNSQSGLAHGTMSSAVQTAVSSSGNVTNLGGTAASSITPVSTLVTAGTSSVLNKQGNLTGYGNLTFSYTSTSTTVVVSWTMFDLYRSDGSITSISSGSNTFSFLTASTCYDIGCSLNIGSMVLDNWMTSATTAGDATTFSQQTLITVLNADGQVGLLVGGPGAQATTAASGGGTGGGTGGTPKGCPAIDMFVREGLLVGDLKVGDIVDCTDGEQVVESARIILQPCMMITTSQGHRLTTSNSTPFVLPDGSLKLADEMDGEMVLADSGHGTQKVWLRCSATSVGLRRVGVIFVGHRVFAAGERSDSRIYSHNQKIIPPMVGP